MWRENRTQLSYCGTVEWRCLQQSGTLKFSNSFDSRTSKPCIQDDPTASGFWFAKPEILPNCAGGELNSIFGHYHEWGCSSNYPYLKLGGIFPIVFVAPRQVGRDIWSDGIGVIKPIAVFKSQSLTIEIKILNNSLAGFISVRNYRWSNLCEASLTIPFLSLVRINNSEC